MLVSYHVLWSYVKNVSIDRIALLLIRCKNCISRIIEMDLICMTDLIDYRIILPHCARRACKHTLSALFLVYKLDFWKKNFFITPSNLILGDYTLLNLSICKQKYQNLT